MNTLHTIAAYRFPQNPRLWVFDDERFGFLQEPFLWEASDFISAIVKDTKHATLIFSDKMFPGATAIFARTWTGERVAQCGCEYHARYPISENPIVENSVWLCPAMIHYFGTERAPEFIFGQVLAA